MARWARWRWCRASAPRARCCSTSWRRSSPQRPVLFLDTGKHFPETLAYRDPLVERLGLTDLRVLTPDPAVLAAQRRNRAALVVRSRRLLRNPQGPAAGDGAEPGSMPRITGRKAFQSATRANLPRFEIDTGRTGRLKINPLIDWSAADLAALHRRARPAARIRWSPQGYPSIGCSPCTSKVAPGEDPRSGRWRAGTRPNAASTAPRANRPRRSCRRGTSLSSSAARSALDADDRGGLALGIGRDPRALASMPSVLHTSLASLSSFV